MTGYAPQEKYYRPGQFVFREGEVSRSLFIIKKGTVSIRKMKGSAFVEIARVFSNEILGELSFFDRLARSASAIAITEVDAMEISFESLDKIYATVPDYMKTIIACMAERLRRADDTIRRLQKDVIKDEDAVDPHNRDNPSAADVLAATAKVLEQPKEEPPVSVKGTSVPEKSEKNDKNAANEPQKVSESSKSKTPSKN